jgi:hypothetical protein
MTFKLEKKSANHVLVKYHITDKRGDICGSVNVSPEEESDLLKCWAGSRLVLLIPPRNRRPETRLLRLSNPAERPR